MGVVATLQSEGVPHRRLPDPSGGTVDAAGDFDRLLGERDDLPLWSSIDAYGTTVMEPGDMPAHVQEVVRLRASARDGSEARALDRLRVLATKCEEDPTARLVFDGD
ncbi:MAG TPA: hypothetical protein VM287_10435 [Egibacteraceae bacterium]|nr:hypothetical protein [Egibacteraceae bacterium]